MSNKTALIIESDSNFANQLSSALSPQGFSSQILADGADGLAHAKDYPPSLIVLCVELPKMSGYAVCNKLKKSNRLKDVPLLIMSSEATPETFEQHRKLKTRADEYILKGADFSMETFIQKVQAIMPAGQVDQVYDGLPVVDPLDVAFEEEEHTGVDREMLKETNAALDSIGAEDDFDLNIVEEAEVPSEGDVEEEIISDEPSASPQAPVEVEEELADGLDLGLEEVADTAAAEAAQPAPAPAATAAQPAPAAAQPAPSPAASAELAALREERDRLQIELAAMKATPATKGTATDRDREFLNLRGVINKKEKEVLDLKDHLSAKDREILDIRDRVTQLERAKQDLDSLNLELEGARVELQERVGSLEADQLQAVARIGDLEGTLREKEGSLSEQKEHLHALERAKTELEALKASELEAAANAITEAKAAHAEELEQLRNRQAGEVIRLGEERDSALAEQKAALEGRIAALEDQHARELAALKSAHEAALGEAHAANAARVSSLETEHRDALAQKAQESSAALAEAEARHEQAIAALGQRRDQIEEELRAKHQADTDGLRGAHREELQRLKDEHSAASNALTASHQQELQRLRDEHSAASDTLRVGHQQELQRLKDEHRGAMDELRGQHVGKVSGLESRIAELEAAKRTAEERAKASEDELRERNTQIAAAVDQMQSDRAAVANTKKALVVALTLLEEQFQDGEDGGTP